MRNASLVRQIALLFALALLAPAVLAGSVRRVGPGQTYTTIQAAIDASAAGDLVLVEPGTYPRFQVGMTGAGPKQLSIVANGASFTLGPTPGQPEVLVENVPLGRSVTIVGARILYDDPAAPAVVVRNCNGAVRFSQLDVVQSAFLPGASVSAAVEVANAKSFWLSDSSIWGAIQVGDTTNLLCVGGICNDGISGLQLTNSSGVIQNSRISGYENSSTLTPTGYGGDGLRLIGECSTWLLENTLGGLYPARLRGGAGIYGGNAVHQVRTPTQANLNTACGGTTSPSFEPGARLIAGVGRIGGFYGFNNTNGSVSTGGGPVTFQVPRLCGLTEANEVHIAAPVVPLGGTLTVDVWTRKARRYALMFSDKTRYVRNAGLSGRGLLDLAFPLLVVNGTTSAQTALALDFPVPSDVTLIGFQLAAQAATGPVGGTLDALTLPTLAVIGP